MKSQTDKLIAYLKARPWQTCNAPDLALAMSESGMCLAFSKRLSEARKQIESEGGALVKSKDEYKNGSRHTGYRYIPHKSESVITDGPIKMETVI